MADSSRYEQNTSETKARRPVGRKRNEPTPEYHMPQVTSLADLEDEAMYFVISGVSDAFGSEVKGYTGRLLKRRLRHLDYNGYSSTLSRLPPGYGLVEIDETSNRCFAARKIVWATKKTQVRRTSRG